MLTQQTLDQLWDFEHPDISEARFRAAMSEVRYDADERAELETQLGRAIGLQGRFEEADAVLDTIDGEEPTVAVRVLLERGRVLDSSGHAEMAVPLLEQAAVAPRRWWSSSSPNSGPAGWEPRSSKSWPGRR